MADNKSLKEELLEQAKQIAENADATAYQKMQDLKKRWKRVNPDEESLADVQLQEQFDALLAKVAKDEDKLKLAATDAKKVIIEEAKKLLETKSFKQASTKLDELMNSWKACGRTDKETDDALWAEFKEVKNQFYANRKAYYENLTETFSANKAAKEALIQQAQETAEAEKINEASKKMDELMDAWKAVGSAGKNNDEELWTAFKAARQTFFDKRKTYYAGLKETYAERTAAKKEIIAAARKCLANSTFKEEEINEVKSLRAKWKEVGNAGKDNENALWSEFNDIVNTYFQHLREDK